MNTGIKIIMLICGCFLISSAKAILPDRTYRFYPEKLGLIYKDLDVTTKDGLKIKSWFFPAQDQLSDEAFEKAWEENKKQPYRVLDDTPRPTLIICNSDAGNMSWIQLHLAQKMTALGYNVVAFDWRAFGQSAEWPMDKNYMCYTEMIWDYDAVINEVVKQPEVDTSQVIVMGWSTGSYLSMIAANGNPAVTSYIGIATPTSFEELLPILKEVQGKKDENLIVPDDFPRMQMPVYIASTFDKPTFLIVGSLDNRTPVSMTEKIYSLLPATTQKDIWIVENAEHGGKTGPVTHDFEAFIKKIDTFLKGII